MPAVVIELLIFNRRDRSSRKEGKGTRTDEEGGRNARRRGSG